MTNNIPVVGGPLAGRMLPNSAASFLSVPDRREVRRFIDDDGLPYSAYGTHTYEHRGYILGSTGAVVYHWAWISYRPPGEELITDWGEVQERLSQAKPPRILP